jgi:hypothetical protein
MSFDCNKLQKGERHGFIKMKGSLFPKRASWMGPGTQVIKRLNAGCGGKSVTDTISKAHDLRYSLAQNDNDTRRADEIMIRALQKARKDGTDNWFNISQGLYGIGSKVTLENLGLMKKGAFNVPKENIKNYTRGEKELMRTALRPLAQKGYGDKKAPKKKPAKKKPAKKKPAQKGGRIKFRRNKPGFRLW